MTKLLEIDPDGFEAHFARKPYAVRHNLVDHDLLTVERVAELADFLPESDVEHNLGNVDKLVPSGEAPRLDQTPGEVARGIETNGCWMVLKNVEQDPAYKALLDETLEEVSAWSDREGGQTLREAFIFLTAPNSMTPAHVDPEHNFLLQIRGDKVMHTGAFPDAETKRLTLEAFHSGAHRNIDWEPVDHKPFPLAPGDGVYMPVAVPHWVTSGPEVSVSLSITFRTPATQREARLWATNNRLRKLKLAPKAPGDSERTDKVKDTAARALSRLRRAS
jgi:ribosomal protein L16 Arg81 hydroxylase